jgi:hypothetical protein
VASLSSYVGAGIRCLPVAGPILAAAHDLFLSKDLAGLRDWETGFSPGQSMHGNDLLRERIQFAASTLKHTLKMDLARDVLKPRQLFSEGNDAGIQAVCEIAHSIFNKAKSKEVTFSLSEKRELAYGVSMLVCAYNGFPHISMDPKGLTPEFLSYDLSAQQSNVRGYIISPSVDSEDTRTLQKLEQTKKKYKDAFVPLFQRIRLHSASALIGSVLTVIIVVIGAGLGMFTGIPIAILLSALMVTASLLTLVHSYRLHKVATIEAKVRDFGNIYLPPAIATAFETS